MNKKLRQTLIGLIWPGPIAGPWPLNLFRFSSPILVFYLGAFSASLIMAIVSSILVVFYFEILELTGGRKWVEEQLGKIPRPIHQIILNRTLFPLLAASFLIGIFPLALSFRLLNYPKTMAESVLVVGSFLNSFLWTGIVWGAIIEIFKSLFS